MQVWTPTEVRVLEAVKNCCARWGFEKVTIEDIARESNVSRATMYRIFPGGKVVIFEAHRVYELDQFFAVLRASVEGATTLEELLVRAVTCATNELRNDKYLAVMLASEPGGTLSELTVEGVPRIMRAASESLAQYVDEFLPRSGSGALIDVVSRLVISYFLSPSDSVDLGDEASARAFLAPFVNSVLTP